MTSLEGSELSEREVEILQLVATGASNKEIAHQLFISPNTVKVHLRNIFTKIGALSRTEAAFYAVRNGLIEAVQAAPSPSTEPRLGLHSIIPAARENIPAAALPPARKRLRLWPVALAALLLLAVLSGVGFAIFSRPGEAEPALATTAPAPTTPPRWQMLTPLASPRSGLAAAAFENTLYTFGGEAGSKVSAAVEAYDPAANAWTPRQPMPFPLTDIQAAVLGGKIYIPGGRLADGSSLDRLAIYDPLSDSWESGPPLPLALSAYALAAFEGRLYLFGGWDGSAPLDTLLEYDPMLQRWSFRTPLPLPRAYSSAVAVSGGIHLLGGYDGLQALSANDVYHPNLEGSGTSPWQLAAPLPEGRYAMGSAMVADTILVIGGVRNTPGPAQPVQFFPSLNQWIEVEDPNPQAWSHLSAASIEQLVYALGGKIDGQATSQAQSYQAMYMLLLPIVR